MSQSDFFSREEIRELGQVAGAVDRFENGSRSSLKDADWSGFKPQNLHNRHDYLRVLPDQTGEEANEIGEELDDFEKETAAGSIKRKRLGSPPLETEYPSKRLQDTTNADQVPGSDRMSNEVPEIRTVNLGSQQCRKPKFYSLVEYQQTPLYERNFGNAEGQGPAFQENDNRGRSRPRALGQIYQPVTPRQKPMTQLDDRYDNTPVCGRNGSDMRRGQSVMPETSRVTPYHQRSMSMAPGNHQSHRDLPNYYDLTTLEDSHRERNHIQLQGSSRVRRNPAQDVENLDLRSEPFEFRAPYEGRLNPFGTTHSYTRERSVAQCSKPGSDSSPARAQHNTRPVSFATPNTYSQAKSALPGNRVGYDSNLHPSKCRLSLDSPHSFNTTQSYSRAQSVAPDSRTSYSKHSQHLSTSAGNFRVQGYTVDDVRQHSSQFKKELRYDPRITSGESNRDNYADRPRNFESERNRHQIELETAIDLGEDDDSENDLESCFRPRKKPSAAPTTKGAQKSSSRNVLSQPLDFGSGRRNGSGIDYSQGATVPYQDQRINPSNFVDLSSPSANDNKGLYGTIETSFTQRPEILAKEKAEQHRQNIAAQKFELVKKRAEALKDYDDLFEELPIDESLIDQIKDENQRTKKRNYLKEDHRLIQEHDQKLQEELAARQKQRDAEEREEQRQEKLKRLAVNRPRILKEEETRIEAKRKAALHALERRRQFEAEESSRAERLAYMELNKEAAKKRAAALQSARKSDKASTFRDSTQSNKAGELPDSTLLSDDDGLFILDHNEPMNDSSEQQAGLDKEIVEKSANARETAPVTDTGEHIESSALTTAEEPETVMENGRITSSAVVLVGQLQTVEDREPALPSADASDVKMSSLADEPSGGQSTAVSSAQETQADTTGGAIKEAVNPAIQRPKTVAHTLAGPSSVLGTTIKKSQISSDNTSKNRTSTSIADIVNDGRRRPSDAPKPKNARQNQMDPIRFMSVANSQRSRTPANADNESTSNAPIISRSAQNAEREARVKLRRSIEKEKAKLQAESKVEREEERKRWNAMMNQLQGVLKSQEAALEAQKKVASDRNKSDIRLSGQVARSGQQQNPFAPRPNISSQTSRISLTSQVESQKKQKKQTERVKALKYEKDKGEVRKRYEREIRKVLLGQGLEQDDEKIIKQLDERMIVWEANRRKKECRESGGSIFELGQPSEASVSDIEESASPPIVEASDVEEIDPDVKKAMERQQTIRAGLQALAAQNMASSDFAKAASKQRTQQLDKDSEESEEDPDSDPEEESASTAKVKAGNPAVRVEAGRDEAAEDIEAVEADKTLRSDTFDDKVMLSLPEPPQRVRSMLPDLVNPPEKDIIHSYVVRHRAERGDSFYESVVLGGFHSLNEANTFARQKLGDFVLGPMTGKSESHDDDNLYVGRAITDKLQFHAESIWVTREIIYIGDVANLKRGDLKNIVQSKVYNIVQVIEIEQGKSVGSVVATASIKALANKKAADLYLTLSKPSRPRMDWMDHFNDVVTPMVRQKLKQADDSDEMVQFGEGVVLDGEKRFAVTVSENLVVGPLN